MEYNIVTWIRGVRVDFCSSGWTGKTQKMTWGEIHKADAISAALPKIMSQAPADVAGKINYCTVRCAPGYGVTATKTVIDFFKMSHEYEQGKPLPSYEKVWEYRTE